VTPLRYHFSGIAGAGMGPLACLMRARGHVVQGSDRAFDQGKKQEIAAQLRQLGIELAVPRSPPRSIAWCTRRPSRRTRRS
jgi:UDP-N-acetylmuramate-alanine ligase